MGLAHMGDRRGHDVMYLERWVILTNKRCTLVYLQAELCDKTDTINLRKALSSQVVVQERAS